MYLLEVSAGRERIAIRALPIWERLVPEKGVVPLSMRVTVLEERSKPRKPARMPWGGLV